jgi:transcriptional regulator with XRE-family HTH domain
MDVTVAFGRAIKARRAEIGMNQETLAHTANISVSFMSGVERGSRQPGIVKTRDIAAALGLKTSELWARTEALQDASSTS